MSKKNTEGLKKYCEEKNQLTFNKVNNALIQLKRASKKITVSAIARKAGVSVATIYNNPSLIEKINQLKIISKAICEDNENKSKVNLYEERYRSLKVEYNDLKIINSKLLANLEIKTMEVVKLKERLAMYERVLNINDYDSMDSK